MSSEKHRWFQTREKFDAGDCRLEDAWAPFLYAVDVSCGGWRQANTIRRALARLGYVYLVGKQGEQLLQGLAELLDQAYRTAFQELSQPLPDLEAEREQIRLAIEMVWELSDEWQPKIGEDIPAESAADARAMSGAENNG